MKSILIAAAAAVGFAGAALAEGPQLLTDDQMDKVVGGAALVVHGQGNDGAGNVTLGNGGANPGDTAGNASLFGLCSGGGNTAQPDVGCP